MSTCFTSRSPPAVPRTRQHYNSVLGSLPCRWRKIPQHEGRPDPLHSLKRTNNQSTPPEQIETRHGPRHQDRASDSERRSLTTRAMERFEHRPMQTHVAQFEIRRVRRSDSTAEIATVLAPHVFTFPPSHGWEPDLAKSLASGTSPPWERASRYPGS